jgi:D-alanine transaminase
MGRLVYINGKFVKEEEAYISIFDRGFLFSDAIYEVTAVIDKKLVSWEGHLNRLRYSLSELNIKFSYSDEELFSIHKKLIVQNKINEGLVYLQISRGKAERDFAFPKPEVEPTIVLFTQIKNLINNPKIKFGSKVISSPDLRWGRADIKTVQLLYSSIMKQKALDLGKDDVWFENNKLITEGSSNNTFIISNNGTLITRSLSTKILPGITRKSILEYAKKANFNIEEKPFTIEDTKNAKEAFSCSSTTFIMPVVEIDDCKIGTGTPGQHTLELRKLYINNVRKELI